MISKKNFVLLLSGIIIVLVCSAAYLSKQIEKIPKLDEVFLQEVINDVVTNKGKGKKGGVDYTLESVNIQIDNAVNLDFVINLQGHGFSSNIIASLKGVPVYKKNKKAFYFAPSKEVNFKQLNVTGKFKPSNIIGKLASKSKFFQDLEKDNEFMKMIVAKGITIYLEKMPIYKLPDDKLTSKVVGIALNEVTVENGEINIDISYWELTKTFIIFVFAIGLAIIMAIAFIMHPKAFAGFVILDITLPDV